MNVLMNLVVIFFLLFNFTAWLHYAYFVSKELCEILNIDRFSIKEQPLKEVQVQIE